MLGVQTVAFATLWVSLSLATPGTLGAQAEMGSNPRQPRFLLAVAGTWKPIDVQRTPALSRHIALDFNGESLAEALAVITRRSGLRLAYTEDVLPRHARVQLRASEISVAGALSTVLLDAGVDVVFTSGSRASLVRRVAVAPPPVGSVVGRVTDAETGEGIGDVEVLLERTRWRTLTEADGQYRLTEVDTGIHAVTARRIGYTKQSRSVVVVEAQEVRVDFALEKSAQQLDEVVTTGTVIPTEVKALPTPIRVINEDEIVAQRPRTTQELFRQAVPTGVSWDQPNAPYYTAFSVRGASTLAGFVGQMKVFVDGVEMATPSIAAVDPNSIERVEVIRGPQASTVYGPDAIGGVIQMFTKRGDASLTRPQIDAEAGVGVLQTPYAGNDGVVRQGYKASMRGAGADVTYGIGGGYSHTGNYLPTGDESAQSSSSAYGSVRFERGLVALDVSGRYYRNDVPPVNNPLLSQTGLSFFSRPFYRTQEIQNHTVGSSLYVTPFPWWRTTMTVGVDRARIELLQTRPRFTSPGDSLLFISDQNWTKTSIGANTSFLSQLGGDIFGTITLGFDHYSQPLTQWSTTSALNNSGTIEVAPGGSISASRATTNNTGYFAQMQLAFRDALFLTGGVRGEENTNFGDSLGTPISPRVGLSYVRQLGQTTVKVRGSYGRAIRAPSPGQKLGAISSLGVTLANPELGPERQQGWDVGVDLVVGSRGSIGVTYYDQTAKNLIQSVQLQATPLTIQNQNVARVSNRGIEVEGNLFVGPLVLRGQYGYTRSRVEQLSPSYTGDLQAGDQTLGTPKHTAGASLSMTPFEKTTVAAGLTYQGSWNATDFLALFGCFGGATPCRPTARDYVVAYPSFVRVNLNVTQRITDQLAGFVAVANLTNDESYELENLATVVGRTTTVGLQLHY